MGMLSSIGTIIRQGNKYTKTAALKNNSVDNTCKKRNSEVNPDSNTQDKSVNNSTPQSGSKVGAHKFTKANEKFVNAYGFGDLANDQIRQYRDRAAAIMRSVKRIDASDKRISMEPEVRKLIKKAGANPKHRGAFNTLYGVLVKDKARLSSSQLQKLTGLLDKTGDISASPAGRAATVAMVKNPAYSKNKMVYALAPSLISLVSKSGKKPQDASSTVNAMTKYVMDNGKSTAELKIYGGYVKKHHPKGKTDGPKLKDALKSIATSKNPEKTGRVYKNQLEKNLAAAKNKARDIELKHYSRILQSKIGMKKGLATKMAKKIYELGGPQSPAGAHLIGSELSRRGISAIKPASQQLMQKTIGEMQKHSLKYSAQQFLFKNRALKVPSGEANSAKVFSDKIKGAIDGAQVGVQVIDTAVTALALENVTVLAVTGGLAIGASVIGGVFSLMEIGGSQRRFIEEEGAQYSQKGHLAAMDVVASWTNIRGDLPPMETAYAEAKRGRHTPRYALRKESFDAYKMAFENTFRHLARMTVTERKNYFKAYKWAKANIK